MPNFALQNQHFLFLKKAKTNRVIKMILYQIHRISNTFISNNNERKNKTKMQATSAPSMNQISQHALYTRKAKFIMAVMQTRKQIYDK